MEQFLPMLIMFVAMAAFAVFGIYHARRQSQQLESAFRRIATRYRGRLRPGGLFHRPAVMFRHEGVDALLDTYSTGGKNKTEYTQLKFRWPDFGFRCEVYPETFAMRIGKLIGVRDIEIGQKSFDERYIISGNSTRTVRELLTPTTRICIDQLRALTGNDDIYVGMNGGWLLIKKRSLLRDPATLSRFVKMGIALYDAARAGDLTGVEFVESEASQAPESVCQVCGEPVAAAVAVRCRSCHTPHHAECWDYFGSCSTYGCGERHYVGPRRR